MVRIIGLELKMQLKSRKTLIVFLTGILMSVMIALLSINTATSRNIILDKNNKVAYSSGKMSVDYLKESQKEFEGFLTEEKCVEIVKKYKDVLKEYDGKEVEVPHDIYAKEITPLYDILNVISYSFSTSYEGDLDINGVFPEGFEAEDADRLYEQRLIALKKVWQTKYIDNPEIREKLEKRENHIKRPFYFSNYSGWDNLKLNIALILVPIIILLSCILVAPVFSKRYEDDSDRVLRATKFGRCTLAIARLFANMVLTIFFYILSIGTCVAIGSMVFNWNGLKASVQFIDLFASSSLNIGQLLIITILGGLLATITMAVFTMFISSAIKSSIVVLAVSAFITVVNMILNIFETGNINGNMLYFWFNTLSPYSAVSLSHSITSNAYACIGKLVVWLPVTTLFGSLVFIVACFLLCIKKYNNHQN